jgi:hypothetical protein
MVRVASFVFLLMPALAFAQASSPLRIGDVESVGPVAKKTARARVQGALAALKSCVVDERGKARVSGVARYRALIAPDGSMLASEVASSSLGDREIERCIGTALKTVTFPSDRDDRDTHLVIELLVGDARRPSGEQRTATAGPGDPEFDDAADSTPDVPDAPPRAQVLVEIRALEGTLSDGSSKRAVSRAVRAFRLCYEPRLAAAPGLAGRIALRSKITPRGESSEVKLSMTTLPDELTACVVRAAQLIPFDAPRGPVTAEWSVLLSPGPR